MQAYSEVPDWWYVTIGVISTTFLLVAVACFPTELPIWAAIVALIFTSILSVPLAIMQAITNQSIPLNVVGEVIGGYLVEGKPIANMIFKTIFLEGADQAVSFAGGLKLGHYMKIPPRIMFTAQTVAAVISCFVCISVRYIMCSYRIPRFAHFIILLQVQEWMFDHIVDICTPGQKSGFTCRTTNAVASASLIWGGVGPRRLVGSDGQYVFPLLAFIVPNFLFKVFWPFVVLVIGCIGPNPVLLSRPSLSPFLLAIRQYSSHLRRCGRNSSRQSCKLCSAGC
jgi:OPT family oligopeptide transporter